MARRVLTYCIVAAMVLLSACGKDGIQIEAKASDSVEVQYPDAQLPQFITIWKIGPTGQREDYFEGYAGGRFPQNRRLQLPRDFRLFGDIKTGLKFDPVRFPTGKYTLSFLVNAEHAYQRDFTIQ